MSVPSLYASLTDPVALAVVVACGVVMLLFGGRLLRPAIVLGAVVASGALGVRLAVAESGGGVLGVPPAVWAIGTPIAGFALALVLYRLCLGVLFALAAASAGFLFTVIIVTAIGEAPQAGIENSGVVLESPENAGDGPESSPEVHANTPVLERIQAIAQDAAGEEASVLVASSLDAVARSLSERIDQGLASVTGWLASQTAGISPTLKTLGLTVATVCGLIGLALGLASPQRVARIATSIVGGWMLVAAGSAAWMHWRDASEAPLPIVVLLSWGVLVVAGVFVQSRQKGYSADEKV